VLVPARSLARSRTTAKAVLAWLIQAKSVVWKTKKKQIQNAVGIVSVRRRRLSLCQSVPSGPIPSRTSQNAVLKMPLNSALAVAEEPKEKEGKTQSIVSAASAVSASRAISDHETASAPSSCVRRECSPCHRCGRRDRQDRRGWKRRTRSRQRSRKRRRHQRRRWVKRGG
jgi:hypothetical protein